MVSCDDCCSGVCLHRGLVVTVLTGVVVTVLDILSLIVIFAVSVVAVVVLAFFSTVVLAIVTYVGCGSCGGFQLVLLTVVVGCGGCHGCGSGGGRCCGICCSFDKCIGCGICRSYAVMLVLAVFRRQWQFCGRSGYGSCVGCGSSAWFGRLVAL